MDGTHVEDTNIVTMKSIELATITIVEGMIIPSIANTHR